MKPTLQSTVVIFAANSAALLAINKGYIKVTSDRSALSVMTSYHSWDVFDMFDTLLANSLNTDNHFFSLRKELRYSVLIYPVQLAEIKLCSNLTWGAFYRHSLNYSNSVTVCAGGKIHTVLKRREDKLCGAIWFVMVVSTPTCGTRQLNLILWHDV